MRIPEVVLIRWHDSMSGIGGWHGVEQAEQHATDAWADPLLASGFLVVEAESYVVIASGYNPVHEGEPEVNGTMMIPRSEIVSLTSLAAAWDAPEGAAT